MDKRKLFKDLSRVRQQIFAIIAGSGFIVVLAATIIAQGFDPYLAFQNSIISLIVFALIGFGVGKYYEHLIQHPLIESYRREAQQRVEDLKSDKTKRVVMDVAVSDLKPGMISINAIYNSDKAMLCKEGARLTERVIKTLRDNGIQNVKVEGQVRAQSSDDF